MTRLKRAAEKSKRSLSNLHSVKVSKAIFLLQVLKVKQEITRAMTSWQEKSSCLCPLHDKETLFIVAVYCLLMRKTKVEIKKNMPVSFSVNRLTWKEF